MSRTAVIAGAGALPQLLATTLAKEETPLIVDFQTSPLVWASDFDVQKAEFEKAGALFAALQKSGVTHVVFAGGMSRPKLNPLRMDRAFLAKAPKLLRAMRGGDDGLLRVIASWFEEEGFKIKSPQDIMSDLLAPAGVWGRHVPNEQDDLDMDRGVQILEVLSAQDVGQACVVSNGVCFGIETVQGTDTLLTFVETTSKKLNPPALTGQGVLVKLPKSGQELRVDLPSIGVDTVKSAKAAGLSGIAVKESGALVLGMSDVVAHADDLGLFLIGLPNAE
ncbi:MAG: UDP-2,3-diacylglucosamine diphosphatase LpxI [Pseudomonadota bacterium]